MESKTKEEDSVIRSCAYCLKVCGFPTKLCGGCKKRAYCSKECQTADWSSHGDGQRHINWCRRHYYGEEDVDWEVVPIPNKGLGIRAKKLLLSGLKIVVEPLFTSPNDRPGMKDLGPEGDTLQQKFTKNTFMGANMESGGPKAVALRIARVNHCCQPNAATIYDDTARVAILFALKDIQPGEEISISYYSHLFALGSVRLSSSSPKWSLGKEFNYLKNRILSGYGITCPASCSCNDPTIKALIHEARQLDRTVMTLAGQFKSKKALEAGEKLLEIYGRLNVSWCYPGLTYFLLFRVAVQRSELLPKAKHYILSAAEIFGKICPYSERTTKRMVKLCEHPETDPDHMKIDKMALVSLNKNA